MHCSLYVSMAHCPHDRSQVPGSHKNPGAVVMAGTIKDQFFRKTGLLPRVPKQSIYGAQVTRSRTLGRKHPAFRPCATPCTQELQDATAHRNKSSEFCCPARRSRDFPNRDFRCACGRVLFGFSSRYPASRSRCHGIVHAFADATRRPRLPLVISFPLHRQAEDAAHAPSSF